MSETPRSGDEITTSEGPRRNPARSASSDVVPSSVAATPSPALAGDQLFRNADVNAIRKSTDNIRRHAMTLPSSDALAEVMLAVSSIDFALESIDIGLKAVEDESTESTETTA
jgi:hypothetical protein